MELGRVGTGGLDGILRRMNVLERWAKPTLAGLLARNGRATRVYEEVATRVSSS